MIDKSNLGFLGIILLVVLGVLGDGGYRLLLGDRLEPRVALLPLPRETTPTHPAVRPGQHPLLTDHDIVGARLLPDDPAKPMVALHLTATAAQRWNASASMHLGQRLTIQTRGKPLMTATVTRTDGQIVRLGAMESRQQAVRLVSLLGDLPPP